MFFFGHHYYFSKSFAYFLITYYFSAGALRERVLDNQEVKSEEKMPFTLLNWKKWLEIEKQKWNKNGWKSILRSESEMKKLRDRDREVKFLENFREFKKDRFWSIGKGAYGGYIISLCNLLMLTI